MTTEGTASAVMSSSFFSRFERGQSTDKARREKNEDYAEFSLTDSGLVALLADGMGGGADGERFSRQAVETAQAELQRVSPQMSGRAKIDQLFLAAIRDLHELRRSEPRYKSSGSTLVGALIEEIDGNAWVSIGNIGDSRAYLVDAQGRLRQLTRDHTHYQRLLDDKVSQDKASTHVQASRLTHVLGNDLDLNQVPDFFKAEQIFPGDTLVLCTDGIYKRITEGEMVRTVSKGSAQEAADALVTLALEKQARDNVTALVVRYKVVRQGLPVSRMVGIIAVLVLLVLGALGLGLAYGSGDGNNATAPVEPATPMRSAQPVLAVEETVTTLPSATATRVTPSATLRPGEPTSTSAPTFTVTPSPTPTPTNTPIPPTPVPPTPVPPRLPVIPDSPQPDNPPAPPPPPTAAPPPPPPTAAPPPPPSEPPSVVES
jgi:protein phosphatase